MAKFAKLLKLSKILEAEGDAENLSDFIGDTVLSAGDTLTAMQGTVLYTD